LNTPSFTTVTELGIDTATSDVHPAKASFSMFVTESGKFTLCSAVHIKKNHFLITVTEIGMVTEVSDTHPRKAPSPIYITELGMVTSVSDTQLAKALASSIVTVSGIRTLRTFVLSTPHSLHESSVMQVVPAGTVKIPAKMNNNFSKRVSMVFWFLVPE